MKKAFLKTLWALFAIVAVVSVVSCSEDEPGVKSYEVTVNLTMPDGMDLTSIQDLKLVTTKGTVNDTISLQSASEKITLAQGQYTFAVSGKVKDEATAHVVATGSTDVYANRTVTLALQTVYQSPLVFKAIYTTGGAQGYMVDGYYEIVNNSDEVQYLDGLVMSAPAGNQKKENAWQAAGITDRYECGQGTVVAFPGVSGGKEHPLQPGESVVIAQDAANHAEIAPEGNHCVDLSNANWEIYISNVVSEIDYAAPNLNVIFQNNTYMKAFGLGFFGRAYILAKLPDGMTPEAFAADPANLMTTPNSTSSFQYLMIPSKYVLDAVDIWNNNSETHYPTFLPKDDAKGVLASTAWAGMCVRRKVSKIANGRAYYQDTNNSSNDFLTNQPLTPGVKPTVADQ